MVGKDKVGADYKWRISPKCSCNIETFDKSSSKISSEICYNFERRSRSFDIVKMDKHIKLLLKKALKQNLDCYSMIESKFILSCDIPTRQLEKFMLGVDISFNREIEGYTWKEMKKIGEEINIIQYYVLDEIENTYLGEVE